MTPDPVIIDADLLVSDAAERMFQIHARHLPVYRGGHLVGILSDRDVARTTTEKTDTKTRVEQACTPNPYVCVPDAPLAEVVTVLLRHKIGAALVMEGGQLLGMFTVTDALEALVSLLRPVSSSLGLEGLALEEADKADTSSSRHAVPNHDALIGDQARRVMVDHNPPGIRVGLDTAGSTIDVHSEAGRRSEVRRAVRTVYGRGDDDKSGA